MISKDRLPRTADNHIIYPGMPIFICSPYSIEKAIPKTIHHVEGDNGQSSESNQYWCVFNEDRYFNYEYWEDGNMEHVSIIFADKEECLKVAYDKMLNSNK